jgi:TonB family protein
MEQTPSERPERPRSTTGIWVILGLAAVFFVIVAALVVLGGRERRPAEAKLEELFVIPPSLRLRTEASLNAPVLAKLERGERLEQLGGEGSWVQVRRSDGTVGWAERTYLETKSDHDRRAARSSAIRLLPPLHGEVERKAPLYAGPGIFFPIIGEVAAGSRVTVFTRDHDFYAVDMGGDIGFAEVDAIDLSDAGAALFEVAADDALETPPGTEAPTASLPDLPGMPEPPEDEEIVIPPAPMPEERPAVQGGVYPGVPPGGTDPIVVDRVLPRYPATARASGVEGTVVVRAIVRRNGRVGNVQIVKDLPFGLGEAAASAVRRWRFRPATYQGEPIDVYYNVTVNFRLSD